MSRTLFRATLVAVMLMVTVGTTLAQVLPNPYRQVETWATLPDGRTMGAVGQVTIDPDGEHIWAVIRCDATAPDRFGNECLDSDLDSWGVSSRRPVVHVRSRDCWGAYPRWRCCLLHA